MKEKHQINHICFLQKIKNAFSLFARFLKQQQQQQRQQNSLIILDLHTGDMGNYVYGFASYFEKC